MSKTPVAFEISTYKSVNVLAVSVSVLILSCVISRELSSLSEIMSCETVSFALTALTIRIASIKLAIKIYLNFIFLTIKHFDYYLIYIYILSYGERILRPL